MKRTISVAVLLAVCLATGYAAALQSLRGAEIGVTKDAPEVLDYRKDKESIPRTFEQQPPLVPHLNERYRIDLKENECLGCHMKQPGKDEAKSVELSESHFVDRNGNKLDKPAGSRYFCTQCHVPQVDAKPLVESSFKSVSVD
jgi:cytochrome c-type protein NapB